MRPKITRSICVLQNRAIQTNGARVLRAPCKVTVLQAELFVHRAYVRRPRVLAAISVAHATTR